MLENKGKYTEKVDIWSAGLILFELLNCNGHILAPFSTVSEVKAFLDSLHDLKFMSHVPLAHRKLVQEMLLLDP